MSTWEKIRNDKPWEPVYTDVLDHGFIGLVDFMGGDSSIVNSARVSYGMGTVATRSDEGLIRYLLRAYHSTPFESPVFQFHVKAPVFVMRQWHRHRMASINEYSARYSVMADEMYMPNYNVVSQQASDNKQGRDGSLLLPEDYNAVRTALDHVYTDSYQCYSYLCGPDEDGVQANPPDAIQERKATIEAAAMAAIQQTRHDQLSKPEEEQYHIGEDEIESILRDWFIQSETHVISNEYSGIARELARIILPVATYSQMYWKSDLHNIMNFLRLRMDKHAQYEIRVYAEAMYELLEPMAPMAMNAFKDYRLNAAPVSSMEIDLLKAVRAGTIDFSDNTAVEQFLTTAGCSGREIREFLQRF